ncbi:MAG TPA: adenylate/guanylate cyclase domain-containing protein [Rhizobiales bacterium]|nr:adenylate/guanylate cyclase domain-containing protein [Hyphomicrobiales bacterium]
MADISAVTQVIGDAVKPATTVRKRLPARVAETITRQENSSEILIKLIQIAVFCIWGILYLLAPRPQTESGLMGGSLVPYALGAYLAMNIVGLVWAVRKSLPDWAVYFNVLIDISMLMVLIWSFHIQYNQPPSFYLKSPTFLYVFIFIALRALRFQARFVIAAGLVAATGWILLTAYVVFSDPQNSMITRDYVHYMTSNSVLIGAEVDKVLSILFVTGILALAISRARKLLVKAVIEGAAAHDLSRFFDQSVAEKIRSSDHAIKPGEGIRREAAILYVDIRGFTRMAATMPASDAVCLLTGYQNRLVPVIQKHNGSIDKFLGDGIMASFGAVSESRTSAADALKAVDDIVAQTETWYDDRELSAIAGPKVNMAVAAGPVIFGVLGSGNRLEYTTVGDAVNRAAKLEKYNKKIPSRALTDLATFQAARRQGYNKPSDNRQLKCDIESVGEELDLVILYDL